MALRPYQIVTISLSCIVAASATSIKYKCSLLLIRIMHGLLCMPLQGTIVHGYFMILTRFAVSTCLVVGGNSRVDRMDSRSVGPSISDEHSSERLHGMAHFSLTMAD